jgi:hypothetical protein
MINKKEVVKVLGLAGQKFKQSVLNARKKLDKNHTVIPRNKQMKPMTPSIKPVKIKDTLKAIV